MKEKRKIDIFRFFLISSRGKDIERDRSSACQFVSHVSSNVDRKILYRIVHFDFDFLVGWGRGLRTARIASSKTLFKFLCVKAEHSKYLWARISFATINAWSYETGSMRFCLKLSSVAGSSLKSSFVPTRMIGTDGAWWSISGNHFARTLSNDGGETMEKQMRKTSVWGYDSGRSRS